MAWSVLAISILIAISPVVTAKVNAAREIQQPVVVGPHGHELEFDGYCNKCLAGVLTADDLVWLLSNGWRPAAQIRGGDSGGV